MSSQKVSSRRSRESASTRCSQESGRSGGYPASDVGSRRSYTESRRSAEKSAAPMSARGSQRSAAEYSQYSSGSQSARGSRPTRQSDASYESYRSSSRYSEAESNVSASFSQASYSTSKADEFFDVTGTPRPHMLGFTFKKRPENGFGRTVYGGFTLREVPPPLKTPDYTLAFRGAHPDTKYYAEPNQTGPGFRRAVGGRFWRR